MTSFREICDNGFLLVKDCPLTSFGIFEYGAGQLGLPGDPMRIVKVYRPESAVSDPEFLESLKNIPMIDDHSMLSGFQNDEETEAPEDKGVDGVLTGDIVYNAPWTRGTIKIFSRSMQKLLLKGKKDLSLGYACRYTEKPGVWNGQAYEVVQDQLRGNHIALVGEGRVRGAHVLDGLSFDHLSIEINPHEKGNKTMRRKTNGRATDNSAVAELQKLLPLLADAFGSFLEEENKEPSHSSDPDISAMSENQNEPQQGNDDENERIAAEKEAAEAAAAKAAGAESEAVSEAEQPNEGAAVKSEQNDLSTLLSKVEALVAQIKQVAGGEASDAVEGLQESSVSGAKVSEIEKEKGKAADELENDKLPASDDQNVETAGKGEDASLARFYADMARKDSTYKRVSSLTGAFNTSGMDAAGVAAYGLKKFGLEAEKGSEQAVLNAYLDGVEKGNKNSSPKQAGQAMDAASKGAVSAMDAYLNGGE